MFNHTLSSKETDKKLFSIEIYMTFHMLVAFYPILFVSEGDVMDTLGKVVLRGIQHTDKEGQGISLV